MKTLLPKFLYLVYASFFIGGIGRFFLAMGGWEVLAPGFLLGLLGLGILAILSHFIKNIGRFFIVESTLALVPAIIILFFIGGPSPSADPLGIAGGLQLMAAIAFTVGSFFLFILPHTLMFYLEQKKLTRAVDENRGKSNNETY